MAIDSAPKYSRYPIARVRRLDHLETGLRGNTKPIPRNHRVRIYRAVGAVSSHYDIVRAYTVLLIGTTSWGAAITTIIERGHW